MQEALTEGAATDARAETLPGLVAAFRFAADGSAQELTVDKPIENEADGWLWLHFNLTDVRACRFLRADPTFPTAARDLLIASDEHQQLNASSDCLYGVLPDLVCELDSITEEIGFLHFAMTERLIVSGRRRALSAVQVMRSALRNGLKVATPTVLLETIISSMIDSMDRFSDDIAGKLDRIEERILADDMSEGRQMLGRIRRTTVRLHRQLVILRSLIQRLELDLCQKLSLRIATARLRQRLDWLDTEIVSLRDRAHLLQEEVTVKTAEQTNRNLHVLAVVTTLFMPASLIAGILGMNVGGLPFVQSADGFLWAMGILVASSVVVLWLLKRSGIIRR
ncbi:MAG: CorA family divalent cation transporter [Methyloceanibacter sp.]